MASNGIRDRVAIVGMGCTSFGERWDQGVNDLLVDATKDALASAGVELRDVDAFWLGTLYSGQSGLTLSRPLKIDYKPVRAVSRTTAPPAPRPSATPATPSRPAPTTSRWRSASRS